MGTGFGLVLACSLSASDAPGNMHTDPAATAPLEPSPPCVSGLECYVLGTEVALRKAPSRTAATLTTLQLGTQLESLSEQQGWMKVRVRAGQEGWVLSTLLTPRLPTLNGLLAHAESSTGAERLLWLERARALEPWSVDVLKRLLEYHEERGDSARAARIRAQQDVHGALQLGGCLETACSAWFQWSKASGYSLVNPGASSFGPNPPAEGLFVLERGRVFGHCASAADAARLDPARAPVILATRLLRPLQVPAAPPRYALDPLLPPVLQTLLPSVGIHGLQHEHPTERTALHAPYPLRLRAEWAGNRSEGGMPVPLVLSLELSASAQVSSRTPLTLLAAWDGGPRLVHASLASSVDSSLSETQRSLLGILDADGDGVGEVLTLERQNGSSAARVVLWTYQQDQGWHRVIQIDKTLDRVKASD